MWGAGSGDGGLVVRIAGLGFGIEAFCFKVRLSDLGFTTLEGRPTSAILDVSSAD